MTDEEVAQARAKPDKDGARWKIKIKQRFQGGGAVGLPSTFWVEGQNVYTPFEKYLLIRDLSSGLFGLDSQRFFEPIYQVVVARHGSPRAFTFQGEHRTITDIILSTGRDDDLRALRGHKNTPWRLVFSPDGTRLVSVSDDQSMRLWDVKTAEQIKQFPGYGFGGNGSGRRGEFVAFSADDKYLATAFEETVWFCRPVDGGEQFAWYPGKHEFKPQTIRFSRDARSLFAFAPTGGVNRKALRFAQFELHGFDGDPHVERDFESKRVASDGLFLRGGKRLITWDSRAPEVTVWDIETKTEVAVWDVARQYICDVALSRQGDLIATCGDDNEVKFWSTQTFKRVPTKIRYRAHLLDSVQFSWDGKSLITTTKDAWLAVWDAPDPEWPVRAMFNPLDD